MVSLCRFRDGVASAGWSVRKPRQGKAVHVRTCRALLNRKQTARKGEEHEANDDDNDRAGGGLALVWW